MPYRCLDSIHVARNMFQNGRNYFAGLSALPSQNDSRFGKPTCDMEKGPSLNCPHIPHLNVLDIFLFLDPIEDLTMFWICERTFRCNSYTSCKRGWLSS